MKRLMLAGFALATLAAPAFAADPISGKWKTQGGDAIIQIGDCGRSTCGRIVQFLKMPPQGADQRDVNNPDASKRDRKLLGLPVLTEFTQDGDEWRGRIYDPKKGKDYRSVIRRQGPNTLEVKGCLGPFCKTQNWTRVG